MYSEKLDLFFQIDAASEKLVVIDARTGQRLLSLDEEEAGRTEAERRLAEETAARQREAEGRRQAEARGLRRGVEDLCVVLGLAWDAERRAQVERMSPSQLETLRQHLVKEKNWLD